MNYDTKTESSTKYDAPAFCCCFKAAWHQYNNILLFPFKAAWPSTTICCSFFLLRQPALSSSPLSTIPTRLSNNYIYRIQVLCIKGSIFLAKKKNKKQKTKKENKIEGSICSISCNKLLECP
jgi:hypothetical protein